MRFVARRARAQDAGHSHRSRSIAISLLAGWTALVFVIGKQLGIYALEEHFAKQLVEQKRRRDGPVLRFDEALMWREIQEVAKPYGAETTTGCGAYEASAIDSFKTGQTLADPAARELYLRAVRLLEAFRRDELRVAEVFDAKRLATYFALTDLLGAEHGARWHNMRRIEQTRVTPPASWTADDRAAAQLRWRMLDTRAEHVAEILPYSPLASRDELLDATRREPNLSEHRFVTVDEAGHRAEIRPGSWVLERDLVVPASMVLCAGPGTRLDLRNRAKIVSHSPPSPTSRTSRSTPCGATCWPASAIRSSPSS